MSNLAPSVREIRITAAVALLNANLERLTANLIRLRAIVDDEELYSEILDRFEQS